MIGPFALVPMRRGGIPASGATNRKHLATGAPTLPGMDARSFDFWLGTWRCTWDGGEGTNTITRALDDHVILERFTAAGAEPFEGMSMSVFDPVQGWRQTWVDSNGSYWHFVGGHDEAGDLCFTTPGPVDADRHVKRMVFGGIAPDAFAWRWESSSDAVTWTPRWAIDYRRASP
jgi:hypothetical protein